MFGASRPAFGQTSTSPFGQQTQSTTNAFGQQHSGTTNNLFGSSSANNAQSGFGGFGTGGANTNPTQTINSPFGMSQQQNTTTSPFGGAAAGAAAGNSLSNPPSLFGGSQSSGTATGVLSSGPPSGTGIKPFQPYTEKDVSTGYPSVFQSITCMPEYSLYSFEELRFQDYQQNRKFSTTAGGPTASAIASPFGQQQTNGTNNTFGLGNKNTISAGGATPFGQQPANSPFGQQQPVNAFSQPNNTPFGQPQQQQQTGMFGQQQNNSPFGQNTASSSSPFGLNKPATSGGLFGQNTTNNNSAFGQANNSLFGQQNQQQNPGNAFGQNTGSNTFGSTFGQTNTNNQPGGLFGQNNTTAANTGGLFGQQSNANNAFGQNNNTSGGLFGSKPGGTTGGGLFGQQAQNGPSPFGQQNAANSTPFGQVNNTQAGGLFGQNNTNTGGGLFGQQQPSNTNSTGLFGQQSNAASTGGPFGQQNSNSMNQQGGGLFGAKPTTGGLFGSNNQSQQGSTGLFGAQNKTVMGGSSALFGQNNQQQQSGGLFGQSNQPSATGGLFGNQNQQTQQPNTGGLFGQQNNSMANNTGGLFGAKPTGTTGGLFGQSSQQQNTSSGLFGQNNNQNNTATGGLFGQNNQQQGQSSGSLFGAKPSGTNALGATNGGLFGGNTQQQNTATGGLFGAKPADSASTSGGLFGTKPAGGLSSTTGGGLFGGKPAGTAPFGATNTNNASSIGGGSLFSANKPANTGSTGLFGSQNNTSGNANTGGLFSSSSLQQNQQMQNQQQAAQANSNPYGTDELFSRVISIPNSITQPTKPSATMVSADLKKKNSLSAAYKLLPKPLFDSKKSEPNSRKVKIHLKLSKPKEEDTSSTALTRKPMDSSIFTASTDEAILTTGELLFNPDKKSFKNLIINRQKMEEDDTSSGELKFITFNTDDGPQKKMEQKENNDIFSKIQETPVSKHPDLSPERETSIIIDTDKKRKVFHKSKLVEDDISFTENGYYISPSFETLESLTLMDARKVENLVIGHDDYGKIEFLKPVDLSLIPLPSLCGKLVIFENRCCTVSYIGDKPEKGQGLNLPAKITLVGCYPKDKSSGKPIKDPTHPILKKHIENLKSMKEAQFESYDPETGSWCFVTEEPVV